MDPVSILQELIALPGPSGQEVLVREALGRHVEEMGLSWTTDAKGNLRVQIGEAQPTILVTAHMDEIAMIVRRVEVDGRLSVGGLGGIYPWKLGEGPVHILANEGAINGVLSFGSVHTSAAESVVRRVTSSGLTWEMVHVHTGLSQAELEAIGVRPGTRVVVHPARRSLIDVGQWIAGFFLDDRADLVSWLLALGELRESGLNVMFAATAAEEVGGEGALYLMHDIRPQVCVALELGPAVVDSPLELSPDPTVWVQDSYSAMSAADIDLIAEVGQQLQMRLQWQALSGGGSDASCAASHGLCARPFTLGLAMANSHGFEIMHPDAMGALAQLTVALVHRLQA